MSKSATPEQVRQALRVPRGPVDLSILSTDATLGFSGKKSEGKRALADMAPQLTGLQERLAANGYVGGHRSVLLVLQGMDTSGKGGILTHTAGLFDPGGLRITSFKRLTNQELAHDFLWRISKETPQPGESGVFDRSPYDDVLVARVHQLAHESEIERRYEAVNEWEQRLSEAGTAFVKCLLHISKDAQRERLLARLDEPDKRWKFNPGGVDERQVWPDYQRGYEIALERCNTEDAPWYVVPSDRKWYRNWAVSMLLLSTLTDLDLEWPEPDYAVEQQRARLLDEQQ